MTNLTQDRYLKILGEANLEQWQVDTSAAQTIYRGQPMIIDQSADTVNLTPYVDALVVAATDVFVGIAAEGATFASGDLEINSRVQVWIEPTIVGFPAAAHSYTNADLGATVYMSTSGALSATAADNPQIGILHRVQDGIAYVRLTSPQICTGA